MNDYFSYTEFGNSIPLPIEVIDIFSEENINFNDKIYGYIYHQNDDINSNHLHIDEHGLVLKKAGDILVADTTINIKNVNALFSFSSKKTSKDARDINLTYEFSIKNNLIIGDLELLEYSINSALPRIRLEKFQNNSQKWHYKYIIHPFIYHSMLVPIKTIKKYTEKLYNNLSHYEIL